MKDLLVVTHEEDKDGGTTNAYYLLDSNTLKQTRRLELKEAAGKLINFEFAENLTRLAILVKPREADAARMTVWSWPELQCIAQWPTSTHSHGFGPDGSWFAMLKPEGVSIIDALTGKALWSTGEAHYLVKTSADGKWLVSSDGKGAFSVWNIQERRKVRAFNTKDSLMGFDISPGNERLVVSSKGDCSFWDFSRLVST